VSPRRTSCETNGRRAVSGRTGYVGLTIIVGESPPESRGSAGNPGPHGPAAFWTARGALKGGNFDGHAPMDWPGGPGDARPGPHRKDSRPATQWALGSKLQNVLLACVYLSLSGRALTARLSKEPDGLPRETKKKRKLHAVVSWAVFQWRPPNVVWKPRIHASGVVG
jgi:hypothetical protein